ncbi:hypothetical protein BOTCAL_0025g00220 [Botryotinia calthae]|uniref:Major facilitator superfamily (MFS) profile domain-containing protein n=1 Tax=Botryotinia calthae TaxID=38488 RepID=A0A4Y8DGF0_9HELO|nr:hypothetical protein BOTCAL_0025g00220 [Botryotinia calthae]
MAHMVSVGDNANVAQVSPIPGTVHLIGLDGTILAKHASGSAKEVVLVPPPLSHPDDPLNWSPKRKALPTFCIRLYVLAVGFPCSAIYSIPVPVLMNTGLTLDILNTGTRSGSNCMASVLAGFIAGGQNWEWCAIFCSFVFTVLLLFFFFLEEKNYDRPATSLNTVLDGETDITSAIPHTGSIDEKANRGLAH